MSELDGLHDLPDLDSSENSESKSSASQESGLCSTMLAMDESLGSLEELSQSVHQQLNSHIDHATLMQYELEVLRAQLAEKNRLISTQQATIKQLQETLSANHREIKEIRNAAEAEIACQNETINVLQSDLAECQQQYADCFQQVVNQDRILSDLREDDAVLLKKVSQLELKLRKKTCRTISTQTERSPPCSTIASPTNPSVRPLPPYKPPPTEVLQYGHRHFDFEGRKCVPASVDRFNVDPDDESRLSPVNSISKIDRVFNSTGRKFPRPSVSTPLHSRDEDKQPCTTQDLLFEIRQIQKTLHSDENGTEHRHCSGNCHSAKRNEDFVNFWNAFTEERQQRLQLDHLIRQMELEMLELKNEFQSCKARFHVQHSPPSWSNCCCTKVCHSSSTYPSCTCPRDTNPQRPPASTSRYTLV